MIFVFRFRTVLWFFLAMAVLMALFSGHPAPAPAPYQIPVVP